MWLHQFDVISQSIMSGHNNMLYITIGIVPVYACKVCDALVAIGQPLTNVHETKWMPHVKWESDVAQSYTSSALTTNPGRPSSSIFSNGTAPVISNHLPLQRLMYSCALLPQTTLTNYI